MSFLNTDFLKNFKVKNLKYHNTHDGISYICELYVDKKKILFAENSGWGGDTLIHFFNKELPKINNIDSETRRIFNDLCEKYDAKKLLMDSWGKDNDNWIDEEVIVSVLIEDFIQLNETKKDVQKFQTKSICFGVPGTGTYKRLVWKKSISTICKTPQGKLHVQTEINKIKKEIKNTNQVILNTNLKKLGLNV